MELWGNPEILVRWLEERENWFTNLFLIVWTASCFATSYHQKVFFSSLLFLNCSVALRKCMDITTLTHVKYLPLCLHQNNSNCVLQITESYLYYSWCLKIHFLLSNQEYGSFLNLKILMLIFKTFDNYLHFSKELAVYFKVLWIRNGFKSIQYFLIYSTIPNPPPHVE